MNSSTMTMFKQQKTLNQETASQIMSRSTTPEQKSLNRENPTADPKLHEHEITPLTTARNCIQTCRKGYFSLTCSEKFPGQILPEQILHRIDLKNFVTEAHAKKVMKLSSTPFLLLHSFQQHTTSKDQDRETALHPKTWIICIGKKLQTNLQKTNQSWCKILTH